MDHPKANALISDLVRHMSERPLEWYVDGINRLPPLMNTSYENAPRLVMTMRNSNQQL